MDQDQQELSIRQWQRPTIIKPVLPFSSVIPQATSFADQLKPAAAEPSKLDCLLPFVTIVAKVSAGFATTTLGSTVAAAAPTLPAAASSPTTA